MCLPYTNADTVPISVPLIQHKEGLNRSWQVGVEFLTRDDDLIIARVEARSFVGGAMLLMQLEECTEVLSSVRSDGPATKSAYGPPSVEWMFCIAESLWAARTAAVLVFERRRCIHSKHALKLYLRWPDNVSCPVSKDKWDSHSVGPPVHLVVNER